MVDKMDNAPVCCDVAVRTLAIRGNVVRGFRRYAHDAALRVATGAVRKSWREGAPYVAGLAGDVTMSTIKHEPGAEVIE